MGPSQANFFKTILSVSFFFSSQNHLLIYFAVNPESSTRWPNYSSSQCPLYIGKNSLSICFYCCERRGGLLLVGFWNLTGVGIKSEMVVSKFFTDTYVDYNDESKICVEESASVEHESLLSSYGDLIFTLHSLQFLRQNVQTSTSLSSLKRWLRVGVS